LAAGALPPLVKLLRGGSDKGTTDTAGALGNLASGNDAVMLAVAAAGALPSLVELLSGDRLVRW
jgi:hypothetical protein